MKRLNILISVVLLIIVAISCSNDDENVSINANSKEINDVVCCFDLSKHLDEISSLDSLESINIPVEVISSGNVNKIRSTRAGEITPAIGTITNLGNQKTLFKYGEGENLVPKYYCGTSAYSLTISTIYKVSVRYELNENYEIKGLKGEKSGWNGSYTNCKQEKWQGKKGDTDYTEFYTYVYDIKSSINGYSAGEHCWVPLNVNDVRIYTRIYQ